MNERRTHTRVLVDTGPLVAIFRRADEHHAACIETLKQIAPPLLTCWPVITEAALLLRRSPMAVDKLMNGAKHGLLKLLALNDDAMEEIATLMRTYRSLGAQLADFSLLHLAQREGLETIFTLDHRDFEVLRPSGKRRFQILPESTRRNR